ncbi:hypothetical protein N0V88_007308 [Collariella sp. IMI 366227]|nr:hypothetical protein N0V88_007308 [Collariella sp. IMI 366227]
MSIPTLLQLELAGQRPNPLYIHHSYTSDIPYESSAIKFERLKNFLLVPWFLERAIVFGALACLDAWLWTFTILPMRFCIAVSELVRCRTKSSPSNLTSFHKADLLQGAIIICSSFALMNLDASRMYHFIRAQSAIKLYAIYNLLEVGDRLLSALGQDIFECLFSTETLSRNSSGRSKVMLPLGMFLLALVYNILHSVILFYQVIALNVAVNSYSNALLTLLMSNQFVEIKGAVFKRFDKENMFQLSCADIVERFQLWVMLVIIGMRNIVEVGGLSVPGAGSEDSGPSSIPLHTSSILPASFTILPSWLWSGEVLSPFIVVIGSEMIVDWVKHAYINKITTRTDAFIAFLTMLIVFLLFFLFLLVIKIALGMGLLRYARDRYARMKVKEHAIAQGQTEREVFDTKGRRTGGFGQVEVGEERRRWIFGEDSEGLSKVRERDKRNEERVEKGKGVGACE